MEDIKDAVDREMERLDEWADGLLDVLEFEAKEIVQPFVDKALDIRDNNPPKNWWRYMPSVRRSQTPSGNARLSVDWKRVDWEYRKGPGGELKNVLVANTVKTNRESRYGKRAFKDASPEELEWILSINDRLDKIWSAMALVGKIRIVKTAHMRRFNK